jgi:hypothetical protein
MEQLLPEPRIDHLARLSDDIGIFEHASGLEPRRELGYTTEDAARALIVTVRWQPQTEMTMALTRTYLAFVAGSIVEGGPIRNRMTTAGEWVGPPSADAHGRTIWGLCVAAAESAANETVEAALSCLERIGVVDDPSIRPWVYTGIGVAELLSALPGHGWARLIANQVLGRLPGPSGSGWIWPEPRLTYDNARLTQCLLDLGRVLDHPEAMEDGLRLLGWLVTLERNGDHFSFTPVGGRGPEDTSPAFDQQPLEASAMADACVAAWEVDGDERWLELAYQAAQWFTGRNDGVVSLYDPHTGAGHDGLTEGGVNANAGAESTISALAALQRGRLIEPHRASGWKKTLPVETFPAARA